MRGLYAVIHLKMAGRSFLNSRNLDSLSLILSTQYYILHMFITVCMQTYFKKFSVKNTKQQLRFFLVFSVSLFLFIICLSVEYLFILHQQKPRAFYIHYVEAPPLCGEFSCISIWFVLLFLSLFVWFTKFLLLFLLSVIVFCKYRTAELVY